MASCVGLFRCFVMHLKVGNGGMNVVFVGKKISVYSTHFKYELCYDLWV